MTKIQKQGVIKRVRSVYLSWVEDSYRFGYQVAADFKDSFDGKSLDIHRNPLHVVDCRDPGVAGDEAANPLKPSNRYDQEFVHSDRFPTDLICVLSNKYMAECRRGGDLGPELVFAVKYRLEAEQAEDPWPLRVWLAPVQATRLELCTVEQVNLGDEPLLSWWHHFLETPQQVFPLNDPSLRTGKVNEAVMALLRHAVTRVDDRCPRCRIPGNYTASSH